MYSIFLNVYIILFLIIFHKMIFLFCIINRCRRVVSRVSRLNALHSIHAQYVSLNPMYSVILFNVLQSFSRPIYA